MYASSPPLSSLSSSLLSSITLDVRPIIYCSIFTRLRLWCDLPPKVCSNGSFTNIPVFLPPFPLACSAASFNNPMGSCFRFTTTEYGSAILFVISSRNLSNSVGFTTRVLPNHLRSGAIRPVLPVIFLSPARSLIMNCPPITVPSVLRIALPLLYIFRRAMVELDRMLPLSPLRPATRLSFEDAVDLTSMFLEPLAGCCLVNCVCVNLCRNNNVMCKKRRL